MNQLKAFYVGDCDVYAARSADEALAVANETSGFSEDDDDQYTISEVTELDEAALDKRYPEFDEDECPIPGETISVREMLESHGSEPGWLCGSDYR